VVSNLDVVCRPRRCVPRRRKFSSKGEGGGKGEKNPGRWRFGAVFTIANLAWWGGGKKGGKKRGKRLAWNKEGGAIMIGGHVPSWIPMHGRERAPAKEKKKVSRSPHPLFVGPVGGKRGREEKKVSTEMGEEGRKIGGPGDSSSGHCSRCVFRRCPDGN